MVMSSGAELFKLPLSSSAPILITISRNNKPGWIITPAKSAFLIGPRMDRARTRAFRLSVSIEWIVNTGPLLLKIKYSTSLIELIRISGGANGCTLKSMKNGLLSRASVASAVFVPTLEDKDNRRDLDIVQI